MKQSTPLCCLALSMLVVLVTGATVAAADHHEEAAPEEAAPTGWFDTAHCAICEPMHNRPDLMGAMQWETHKLDHGMIMTAVIPADKQSEFKVVCQAMKGKTPQPGDPLCGFCEAFGGVLEAGADMQEIDTGFGRITLLTSDDPQLIAKIHAMADRTIEEMERMAAMAP